MSFIKCLLILLFCPLSHYAASIKGKLLLADDWAPVIYISEIPSFEHLNTASYDFLRYQIDLDANGTFEVKQLALAADDRIYRLHICKKGDPISTIMIGGQEENFIHFVMNRNSAIEVYQTVPSKGLDACTVTGHPAEVNLSRLFAGYKKLHIPLELPSQQNRNFIKNQILEEWTAMADTAENEIVRLLAVYFIDENFASQHHLDLMQSVHMDVASSDSSSPYYDDFVERLNFLQYQNTNALSPANSRARWLWLLLVLPLGLWFWRKRWQARLSQRRNDPRIKIKQLSVQEKRVLSLLKKGKTNKEISSELHIEVSTVKSHLNKIYSRLGVKSRRDILNQE